MTVRITSPVLGKAVGEAYTGPLESWLLNEGYATTAATVPTAWGEDSDGILGAKAPVVNLTATAAKLVSSANVATISGAGTIVFGTKGGVRTSVTLANSDNAAAMATKIDTALAGLADAAIVSNKLEVTSNATGPKAYVTVVDANAAALTALKLAVGDSAYGSEGRPTGASNEGPQADLPDNDPTDEANREEPYWPVTADLNATIANDATNLTKETFPAPVNFDFDADGEDADDDAPSNVTLSPTHGVAAGGTVVTLTAPNDNMVGVTAVQFAGTPGTALDVSKAQDGEVKVTTPAHAAGAVTVTLVDAAGNLVKAAAYTYDA